MVSAGAASSSVTLSRRRTHRRGRLPRQAAGVGTEPVHRRREHRLRQPQVRRRADRRRTRRARRARRRRRGRCDLRPVRRRRPQQTGRQAAVHRRLPRGPALRPQLAGQTQRHRRPLPQVDLLVRRAVQQEGVQLARMVGARPGPAPHLELGARLLHHGGRKERAGVVVLGVQGVAGVEAQRVAQEVLVHEEAVHRLSVTATRKKNLVRCESFRRGSIVLLHCRAGLNERSRMHTNSESDK